MQTAVPVDLDTGEWQTTTIGKKFSHTFGYGKTDTWATIEAAKTFKNVKPQAWFFSPWIHVNQAIPQGDQGLAVSFEVTADMLKAANLERLEHVTVTMNVDHTRRGDLSADLISPNNIISHIATTRRMDSDPSGYEDWTFMSVVHWGESGIGTWTVIVRDSVSNEHNGTFVDWHLKLWGESIDASKATMLPMPSESDDDNHAIVISTTTAIGAITSMTPQTSASTLMANPTDHPDRPTKPTGTEDESAPSTSLPTTTPSASSTAVSSWLPSFLPTFGVSSKTLVWIYGASTLILIFCAGIGAYLYMARRKRLRNNPRDEWEFDLLQEDEADGLKGGVGGKRGKRRAGELYDAFAAGSEDELDMDLSESEDGELGGREGEKYRDGDGERHVIGSDDESDGEEAGGSEEGNEKKGQGDKLLHK